MGTFAALNAAKVPLTALGQKPPEVVVPLPLAGVVNVEFAPGCQASAVSGKFAS